MVESQLTYEQVRLRRLEENKKRMEELNLNKLAQSLRSSSSPKPSPVKQWKPRTPRKPMDLSAVRRSGRVANKPPPSYREAGLESFERPHRSYRRRDLLNRVYASDEARADAIDRAEQLQSSLEPEFPSFVKPMLQSHVTGGFWLGLSLQFCKAHLPKRDAAITLVDEEGDEFLTKYLAEKNGLSAGWRGFSIDHQLVDGDALVFQLVAPTKFKVYIKRVCDDGEDNVTDANGDKENENGSSREKENENGSETRQLRSSSKRKRGGRKF